MQQQSEFKHNRIDLDPFLYLLTKHKSKLQINPI